MDAGSCIVLYQPVEGEPYVISALKTVNNLMRHIKKEDAKVIAIELTGDLNVNVF